MDALKIRIPFKILLAAALLMPGDYWCGPIWAPAMYLVIDGLNRGGRKDLAIDLAQRFDRLIQQAGGYYENFDAKTGKGLKTKAYT